MLLGIWAQIQLITRGVTNQDVILLATIRCMFYKNLGKPLRRVYRRLLLSCYYILWKKNLFRTLKHEYGFLKYFQTVIQVLSKSDRYQFENFCSLTNGVWVDIWFSNEKIDVAIAKRILERLGIQTSSSYLIGLYS